MPFFCLLLTGIIAPNNATAGDLAECMTEKMLQANDSVTIGNLRLECEKEIQEGA